MVKTPRTRHSKSQRAPVTIELGADDVKPVDETTPQEAHAEASHVESIEVPEQPDAELFKMERDSASVVEAAPEPESAPEAEASFGRAPDAKPEPQTVVKKGGSLNPVAAGLIGAVLALGGAYGLQTAGVIGTPVQGASVSLEPLETQIAALKGELDGLKAAPAPEPDAGLAAAIEQIKGEIAALQSAAQSGGTDATAALGELGERIGKIEAQVSAPDEVGEKVVMLESGLVTARQATSVLDGRISSLERSVTSLTGKVEQQASEPKAALAIAVTALKSAVERGGAFMAEIETVGAVAPDVAELAALRTFAESGIATRDELLADFSQAIDAMLAAGIPDDPNAGIVQRLFDSARAVVKVRPVGPVAGDDPAARIARMEVALKGGDDAAALAEFDALPDNVKQAGAGFGDKLKARADVLGMVDQLVASALKPA